jgi:hypothetical protein
MLKISMLEVGLPQVCMAKVGAHHRGIRKVRVMQGCGLQASMGEDGVRAPGARQVGFAQDSILQFGVAQVSSLEVGAA